MQKQWGTIYVNPNSKSTQILDQFLAKYIDQINRRIFLKIVRVTNQNVDEVKKRGIEQTPTLVVGNAKYVSLEKIVKILTPPADQKDSFGFGNSNPNDLITQYHTTILDTGDDNKDDDETNPDNRANVLREKMSAFQKRRPAMSGVEGNSKLSGGRRVQAGNSKAKFSNDDEFRKASNIDNIIETPTQKYMDDNDGGAILEEYFLQEAINSGKKVGKPRRRSQN